MVLNHIDGNIVKFCMLHIKLNGRLCKPVFDTCTFLSLLIHLTNFNTFEKRTIIWRNFVKEESEMIATSLIDLTYN